MSQITFEQVAEAILNGVADGQEQRVYDLVKQRRGVLTSIKAASLKEGDIVVTNRTISPKYIQGLKARVLDVKQTRAEIEFLDKAAAGKFGYGPVRAPLSCLEQVAA